METSSEVFPNPTHTHTLHDLNVKTLSAEPLLHRTHSNSDFLLDPRPIIHWQTLSVTDSLTHCLTTIWKTWLMWLISSTPLFAQISAPKFRNLSQRIKICVNVMLKYNSERNQLQVRITSIDTLSWLWQILQDSLSRFNQLSWLHKHSRFPPPPLRTWKEN